LEGARTAKMPAQPSASQIRLNNATVCLTIASHTLEILADTLNIPYLAAIVNTTQAILRNIEVTVVEEYDIHRSLD
jgi:hypothetical protein